MSSDSYVSFLISIGTLIISIIVLFYTIKTYLLKSGERVRGSYIMCSSMACDDKYVKNIILENLKDHAIVIFKIYLKIGHNYFVEIDNFEEKPLILKPFEVFKKIYDPIDLYSINTDEISITHLLDNRKIRKQIVLSTSKGKYKVKTRIKSWDPISDFFKNYFTGIIIPMRSTYKGKSYGSNVKYIVEIKLQNGAENIIPIYPDDYEIKIFNDFQLTRESLISKDSLEEFLYNKLTQGLLHCDDILVLDIENRRNEIYCMEKQQLIMASYYSWLTYHILGPISTICSNYSLKKKNKQLQKKRENMSK